MYSTDRQTDRQTRVKEMLNGSDRRISSRSDVGLLKKYSSMVVVESQSNHSRIAVDTSTRDRRQVKKMLNVLSMNLVLVREPLMVFLQ